MNSKGAILSLLGSTSIVLSIFSIPAVSGFLGVQCTTPEEYKYGQLLFVDYPSSVQTNSWITITIEAKNTGNCNTMYKTYAEVPADLFPRWSFPDYFWLDPGESKTVTMQLYTGGLSGTGSVTFKLESHYTALTYVVDSMTGSITILEESPSIGEQMQQTGGAIQSEVNEEISKTEENIDKALLKTVDALQNSPLSKLENMHFALHFVGENAADEDMQAAIDAQEMEIRISENAADAVAIAIGHSFTPAGGASQAVVQAVCSYENLYDTPLSVTRNAVTQMLLKNDIVSDSYSGEEQSSYISVYLGGPGANRKMIPVNSRMKDLSLPYFDGDSLITPDGRTYGWGYGVFAIIPDVDPFELKSDGTFVINVDEYNRRAASGQKRLYYIVASGTNREGTMAAEKAYLETLEVAEEMTRVIKKGLCAGDLDENDLYVLGSILKSRARTHAIAALEHPEILDMGIEFTQSLMLLGKDDEYKNVKLRPMALIVKSTGDTWTPVGMYYGK